MHDVIFDAFDVNAVVVVVADDYVNENDDGDSKRLWKRMNAANFGLVPMNDLIVHH